MLPTCQQLPAGLIYSPLLQGGAAGLIHGWVDFDLDVPPVCLATQPIQSYSGLEIAL